MELPKIMFCFAKDSSSKRGACAFSGEALLEVKLFLEDCHGGE